MILSELSPNFFSDFAVTDLLIVAVYSVAGSKPTAGENTSSFVAVHLNLPATLGEISRYGSASQVFKSDSRTKSLSNVNTRF